MSVNQYFSTLIVTYLVEAHSLRLQKFVNEDELILNISTMTTVLGTKENIAIPSENKLLYVEQINKSSGTVMIVLDNLVGAGYILRKNLLDKNYYQVNMESDYIKKFVKAHSSALKYVSHPAYSLKRGRPNDEESLANAMSALSMKDEPAAAAAAPAPFTPLHSRTKAFNAPPCRKKPRSSSSSDGDDESEEYEIKKMPSKLNLEAESDLDSDNDTVCLESSDEEEEKEECNEKIVAKLDQAFASASTRTMKSSIDPSITYQVTSTSCTCPAFTFRKSECKHIKHFKTMNPIDAKKSTIAPILSVISLQSDSEPNTYYNVYQHNDGKYTCVCPHFKFHCVKSNTHCKHIDGYLKGDYDTLNPDMKGYVVEANGTARLSLEKNRELYVKNASDVMFDDSKDVDHFNDDTLYLGWCDQ